MLLFISALVILVALALQSASAQTTLCEDEFYNPFQEAKRHLGSAEHITDTEMDRLTKELFDRFDGGAYREVSCKAF